MFYNFDIINKSSEKTKTNNSSTINECLLKTDGHKDE